MKTLAQALADAVAALAPIGDAHALVEGDYLAVLADVMIAMQAGVAMRLPSQGASPVADSVTGTSWQNVDIFDAGSATPSGGGRGLTPNTAAGTLTAEAGGDGWYLFLWHASASASESTEFALDRERATVHTPFAEDGRDANGRGPVLGFDLVNIAEGDVVRAVARTSVGLTSNLSVWSAQMIAFRVLPTE